MKVKKLLFTIILVFSMQIASGTVTDDTWYNFDADAGFSMKLPPGWITYTEKISDTSILIGPSDDSDIRIAVGLLDTDNQKMSSTDLYNIAKKTSDDEGFSWLMEPAVEGDSLVAIGQDQNDNIVVLFMRSIEENLVFTRGLFTDQDTYLKYQKYIELIAQSIRIGDSYSKKFVQTPTPEPTKIATIKNTPITTPTPKPSPSPIETYKQSVNYENNVDLSSYESASLYEMNEYPTMYLDGGRVTVAGTVVWGGFETMEIVRFDVVDSGNNMAMVIMNVNDFKAKGQSLKTGDYVRVYGTYLGYQNIVRKDGTYDPRCSIIRLEEWETF